MNEPSDLDWIIVTVIAGTSALAGLVVYLIALVIRRAEGRDRRRYVLALLVLFGSPVFFAVVTRSLWHLSDSDSAAASVRPEWYLFINLPLAMIASAGSAFVIPFRSLRERGFAIVGGAVTGFAVFCATAGHP